MSRSLKTRLETQILANGPISVADFMALALSDPEFGYYARRDPLGSEGDFVTAPEISQMFGEIIGAWLFNAWHLIGAPSSFQLVELGPGRGTLMADIVRTISKRPEFCRSTDIHLVETSPVLREIQRHTLKDHGVPVTWNDSISELSDGPILFVANEFFDALPIHQYVRSGTAWHERVIGLSEKSELTFGLSATSLPLPAPLANEGDVFEVSPLSLSIAAELSMRLSNFDGAGLIIDYGHSQTGFGDTFQAVKSHKYADPLDNPGEADLTAHVDFQALAECAREKGAWVHGPITQADFLLKLGLLERAGQLGANADEATRLSLNDAVDRLAGTDQMGKLFKVMAISGQQITLPPFGA